MFALLSALASIKKEKWISAGINNPDSLLLVKKDIKT